MKIKHLQESINNAENFKSKINEKVSLADRLTVSMVEKVFSLVNQLIILQKESIS